MAVRWATCTLGSDCVGAVVEKCQFLGVGRDERLDPCSQDHPKKNTPAAFSTMEQDRICLCKGLEVQNDRDDSREDDDENTECGAEQS